MLPTNLNLVNQDWTCPACSEGDSAHRPTPRSRYCDDCGRARALFRTTLANAKSGFNRTNKGSPGIEMDIDEFCKWRKSVEQHCHYCGIAETDIVLVGMKSQIQRPVRTMGVDRVDSGLGYNTANLVPCCFVCNQIKGDRFTESEMLIIGQGVSTVWSQRLHHATAT